MKYLYKGARINFEWTIYKGGSPDVEDLPDDMQVCLFKGKDVWRLPYIIDNGIVAGVLSDTLPEGVYGFSALWGYKEGKEVKYRACEVYDLFALTLNPDKVDCCQGRVLLKFRGKSFGVSSPSDIHFNPDGGQPTSINLLNGWGDSLTDGITQKFLSEYHELVDGAIDDLEDADARHDEALTALSSDVDTLMIDSTELAVTASPSVCFVGDATSFALSMTSSKAATSLEISNSETTNKVTGSGTSLNGSVELTPATANTITITGKATMRGKEKSVTAKVYSVYQIYYGAGATSAAAVSVASARRTPAGTYTITATAGDYLWWVVPGTMSINKVTLSGFDVPMESPEETEIDGVTYWVYQSSNTYQAGTLTLVVS